MGNGFSDILRSIYDMTAISSIAADPGFILMYLLAFVLLYLGIKKHYEPLLLVPIAFGVLIANFPGGDMGVIQADENGMVMVNGVLKNIYDKDARIMKDPGFEPSSPMTSMGTSAVVFQLRVWTKSENYWAVMGDTTEAIYTQLMAAGIEIPFQQLDVHLKQ